MGTRTAPKPSSPCARSSPTAIIPRSLLCRWLARGPRAAMGRAAPAIGITSEAFEEGEQRVAGRHSGRPGCLRRHAGQGLLLQLHVGVDVGLG